MFLVKCECGCFYTLDEDKLNYPVSKPEKRTCPNCGKSHDFSDNLLVSSMIQPDINIKRIPDGAKFSVTFDPFL